MPLVRRLFFLAFLFSLAVAKEAVSQPISCPPCSPGFVNVKGRVVDANGTPVNKVDLDFFHIPTGLKIPTFKDNTNSAGFYGDSLCFFPPAFYRITFEPLYPFNTHLVGKELFNVDLTNCRILPDVVLEFGQAVSGRAVDTLGNSVDSVNLAVDDWVARKRLFTPGDKTDALGNYRIVIPNGLYRFRYAPAPGRRQLGVELDTVKISRRDTIINITIRPGFFVNGTVQDTTFNSTGIPIANVSFDMEDTLGKKIFLPRNKSDSLGKFTVVAPAGIFDFLFVPPRDSHFVAKKIRSFSLATDTVVTQALRRGVLLTVNVHDSLSQPVPFADLDVIREFPTLNQIFTPTDNADLAGVIKVAIPPDSYRIVITPPIGTTNFDTLTLPGLVKIFNDTTIDVILPGQPFRPPVAGESPILDARPNPFRPGNGQKVSFPVDLDASAASWSVSLTVFSASGEIVFRDQKEADGGSRVFLEWDGLNTKGEAAASGVYFCQIRFNEAGGKARLGKVLKVAVIR
jgi:hypothetical protein